MFVPDNVHVPDPALVSAKAVEPLLIIPVIELVPELATLKVPEDEIAAALSAFVVISIPVKGVIPPTAPVKVIFPDPVLTIVKA